MPNFLRHLAADLRSAPWPIWLILVLCALPELFFLAASGGIVDLPRARAMAYDSFGFWAGLLGNWQPNYVLQPYVMFLTYGFLHAGLLHFTVNMLALVSLGGPVAQAIGSRRFLVLYVLLLIAGALGFALWPDVGLPMVGASGALFGLAGLLLAWDLRYRLRAGRALGPVMRSLAVLMGMNLVLWLAMGGHLAWQTHLGGFFAGWAAAWFVQPNPRR